MKRKKKGWIIAPTNMVMKTLGFALFLLCVFSLSGCKALIRWWGGVEKEVIVHSGRSQVGNYEWYFDQYHACKATAQKVKIAEGTPEENQIRMVLVSMVEEYNSRSRMNWTRATWKAEELPYQLSMEDLF